MAKSRWAPFVKRVLADSCRREEVGSCEGCGQTKELGNGLCMRCWDATLAYLYRDKPCAGFPWPIYRRFVLEAS